MSFPGIDYFNWKKIMHNSSHVLQLVRNLFPNDEPYESALGVVNHRQHVDALPDKYDNCRPSKRMGLSAVRGGGGCLATPDI